MPLITAIVVDETNTRVPDVLIRAVDENGVFLQSGTTEENGKVLLLVPQNTAVFYLAKTGYSFDKHKADLVEGAEYEFSGISSALLPASDPTRCRVQGEIETASGEPINWLFRFTGTSSVNQKGNTLVTQDIEVPVRQGKIDVELSRGQAYFVRPLPFPTLGEGTNSAIVYIPDRQGAHLLDVLAPVAETATFDTNALTISVLESKTTQIAISLTDGRVLTDDLISFITIESSDESVVVASLLQSTALITALGSGTATLTIKSSSGPTIYYRVEDPKVLDTIQITVP